MRTQPRSRGAFWRAKIVAEGEKTRRTQRGCDGCAGVTRGGARARVRVHASACALARAFACVHVRACAQVRAHVCACVCVRARAPPPPGARTAAWRPRDRWSRGCHGNRTPREGRAARPAEAAAAEEAAVAAPRSAALPGPARPRAALRRGEERRRSGLSGAERSCGRTWRRYRRVMSVRPSFPFPPPPPSVPRYPFPTSSPSPIPLLRTFPGAPPRVSPLHTSLLHLSTPRPPSRSVSPISAFPGAPRSSGPSRVRIPLPPIPPPALYPGPVRGVPQLRTDPPPAPLGLARANAAGAAVAEERPRSSARCGPAGSARSPPARSWSELWGGGGKAQPRSVWGFAGKKRLRSGAECGSAGSSGRSPPRLGDNEGAPLVIPTPPPAPQHTPGAAGPPGAHHAAPHPWGCWGARRARSPWDPPRG